MYIHFFQTFWIEIHSKDINQKLQLSTNFTKQYLTLPKEMHSDISILFSHFKNMFYNFGQDLLNVL